MRNPEIGQRRQNRWWTTPLGLGTTQVVPVEKLFIGIPQPGSGAELHRGDGDVKGIDEVGVEALPDGVGVTAESDVLATGHLECALQNCDGSPETKRKVVSDRLKDGRACWFMTKTGVWNGGC